MRFILSQGGEGGGGGVSFIENKKCLAHEI